MIELSTNNSLRGHLSPHTKTRPIMNGFCQSGKRYLIFHKICRLRNRLISLVVTRLIYCENKLCDDGDFTITDLKKDIQYLISKAEKYEPCVYPCRPMVKELLEIPQDQLFNGNTISFSTPYLLRAQTSQYYGYGDTSRFAIIGITVDNYESEVYCNCDPENPDIEIFYEKDGNKTVNLDFVGPCYITYMLRALNDPI